MNKIATRVLAVTIAVAGAVGIWWWTAAPKPTAGANAGAAGAASAPGSGPPISVTTIRAEMRDYDIVLEATGTVTALNNVELRPQISSTIRKVHIREGQFVKAGEPLFTLDARSDEAGVAKAEAQLQKDLASLADARRQLARSRELIAQNFISQGAVDTNQGLVDAQAAVVAADRAAIEAARVSLSYSRIVAPSAGRAGAINVFPGSFVQPNAAAPLVTITQLDPIAVSFNLPQRHLADALQTLGSGRGTVEALLPEAGGTLKGKLQFVDNAVDASSGSVRVKAVFDNREQKLWPGAFVAVRLAVQTLKDAIIVPQAAIVQGARGRVVYLVEQGKAAARPIEVVHAAGADAVVTGVQSGERVVLEGRQNLRPGAAVAERPRETPASGAGRGRRGASAPTAGSTSASAVTP